MRLLEKGRELSTNASLYTLLNLDCGTIWKMRACDHGAMFDEEKNIFEFSPV